MLQSHEDEPAAAPELLPHIEQESDPVDTEYVFTLHREQLEFPEDALKEPETHGVHIPPTFSNPDEHTSHDEEPKEVVV